MAMPIRPAFSKSRAERLRKLSNSAARRCRWSINCSFGQFGALSGFSSAPGSSPAVRPRPVRSLPPPALRRGRLGFVVLPLTSIFMPSSLASG
jgi:hypothetical protein